MYRFLTVACALPPGASGSLTGTEALLGPDGNPVNNADTTIITNFELVPGQTEESDYGLYLDFTKTSNPQPIRGPFGGTDPGPREALITFNTPAMKLIMRIRKLCLRRYK
jgi:hypothetical protein